MKTILVLEDEVLVMRLLRHMLKQYDIIEATTAEEALRLFTNLGRIDALIADVILPKSSGIKIALLFRLQIPELPVILTSGFPIGNWSDQDSADLSRLGSKSVAFLQKPFHAEEVRDTVRTLIGEPKPDKARRA